MRRSVGLVVVLGLLLAPIGATPAAAAFDDDENLVTRWTYCDLSMDTGDPVAMVGARWVPNNDAGSTVEIVAATIGDLVEFDGDTTVVAEEPGPGRVAFDQVLTVRVDGVERTMSLPSTSDCTGMPTGIPSASGRADVGYRTSCVAARSGPGLDEPAWLSLSFVMSADGYAVSEIEHDLTGDTLTFITFGTAILLGSVDGPARTYPVDVTITATFATDPPGTGFQEAYRFSYTVPCVDQNDPPPDFADDDDSVFAADIAWLASTGITRGCSETEFCPNDPVTRGQMAAFLVRALGYTGRGTTDFTDDDASVFEADIERLANAGVTRGCTPTRFCPDDPVTRGQMAAFLRRALGDQLTPGPSPDFSDIADSVFADDIEWLAGVGITRGCSDTEFCPDEPVTRGQMAAFLRRALDR